MAKRQPSKTYAHLISPSAHPERRQLMLVGLLARQVTPSSWGSAARKGFAKTLLSLTAFNALQATRAIRDGCYEA